MAGSLICLEVLLTRIFSATLHYHFTFVAVAIGMIGFSAAAIRHSLRKSGIPEGDAIAPELSHASILYAVTAALAVLVAAKMPLLVRLQLNPLLGLSVNYVACFLPFYFGGKAITLILMGYRERFAALYAVDFTAAAVGCLAAAPFLISFGGQGAILVAAIAGLLAVAASFGKPHAKLRARGLGAALVLLGLLLAQVSGGVLAIRHPAMEGKRVLFETWNAISRITVLESPTSPWVQENTFGTPLASDFLIWIDASATTPIMPAAATAAEHSASLELDLSAAPFAVTGGGGRTLVIGAGGGRDLMVALHHGATEVDAVEINPAIANLVMRGLFGR